MYSTADVNVDVFTSKITEGVSDGSDHDFRGIYASLKMIPNNLLDLYVLHNNNLTGTAPQNLYTLGARLKGSIAGLDYIAELPYQSGENTDTVDRQGWAFTADLGYNVPSAPLRIGAGVDFATGDDSGTADENEAFNPLYATTHGVLGFGDVAVANTWSDIFAWNVNATYKITDKTSLYAAYWNYKEDEVATSADDDIGSEIDLSLNYKYSGNISVLLQAARFSPGDAVTTGDDPQDWAAIQLTANF
ncbi:MAG: alginate export family protein, partial [Deltaproteobacteria bacterium]